MFRICKIINFCILLRGSKSFKRLFLEILVLLSEKLYLCVMLKKEKPIFMKSLFWDVEFEKIDYEKRASWVIERVFERGILMIFAIVEGIMAMKKLGWFC
jgi:hypothetical protein